MPATLKKQHAASDATLITDAVRSLQKAECKTVPFKHWLFRDTIPMAVCREITGLPIPVATFDDTYGKRDSHNDLRRFFSPEMRVRFPVMDSVVDIFQSPAVARTIEKLCDIELTGTYLRVEYCQDGNGFWLEPHMDIKEKRMTMQIYLNTDSDAATLGTDMYDADKKHHSSAPATIGEGMIFIPKEPNSWHGFEKRPIKSVRRSLIINYVTDDWRARHELSFPKNPIVV